MPERGACVGPRILSAYLRSDSNGEYVGADELGRHAAEDHVHALAQRALRVQQIGGLEKNLTPADSFHPTSFIAGAV